MDNATQTERNSVHTAMKITVIGCGRWGSFIAYYLSNIGNDVILYGRETSEKMKNFRETRSNGLLTLPDSVILSSDFDRALMSEVIVISIDSQNLRGLMQQISDRGVRYKTYVLCMKGIEVGTGKRLTQVVSDYTTDKTAVWLGPGHVQEFVKGIPNCMVIDSTDERLKEELINEFSSSLIRFYYGEDIIGNEIGAASKNVVGIAAGMLDGLNLSTLKGALMSRGTREISRLIMAMGGNEKSAYGLCHLGDYEATVFSQYSHNRQYGEKIVKGEKYDSLAEGHYTVKALMTLKEQYNVDMPISSTVYDVIYKGLEPSEAINSLFTRSLKKEFYI
jgi:glycerol-3-phosphate dehydrogenase (NAD(P)+)